MSLRAQKYYRSNWVIAGVFVTSIGNSVDTLLLPARQFCGVALRSSANLLAAWFTWMFLVAAIIMS